MPCCPFVPLGILSLCCNTSNSTISNQLVAWSKIVMNIKSMCVLSLLLRVYGPMHSTHYASQGEVIASFADSFPYLSSPHLFTWQLWHFLTRDWTVIFRPFQYIKRQRVSLRPLVLECCRWWWNQATTWYWRHVGMAIFPSFQSTLVFSTSWVE